MNTQAVMALAPIQYTIREVPPSVDESLKAEASRQGVSFNQFIVNELTSISRVARKFRSLDDIAGKWEEDEEFERILEEQRKVDLDLWK